MISHRTWQIWHVMIFSLVFDTWTQMKSILKSLDSLQLRGRNSGHQMCNRFTRRHYYPDCKYLHHNNDNLWDMYFARSDLKQRSLPRIMLSFRNKTHIIESVNVVDIDALFQHSEFCFVSVWIISHSPCLAFFFLARLWWTRNETTHPKTACSSFDVHRHVRCSLISHDVKHPRDGWSTVG